MRILNFTVEGQNLSKEGDFTNIIKGTKGYLKCQFSFDGAWTNCKAAAVFEHRGKEYAEPIASDASCKVPDEVTDIQTIKLRVVGVRENYRISTNKVLISQEG